MKYMYTVGVLIHGVHHTLPVSQHWFPPVMGNTQFTRVYFMYTVGVLVHGVHHSEIQSIHFEVTTSFDDICISLQV